MAALGLDPFRYLYEKDPIERSMLVELANRTLKYKEIQRNNLAVEIANQMSKSQRG